MKLAKVDLHEEARGDKREFSRFKTIGETLKRTAVVATLLASATFAIGCGGGPDPQPDGSGGSDGGVMTDGGHDGGSGGDGGSSGLCATYPHGSPNRAEMFAGTTNRPGNNTEGWLMFFKSIVIQSDGTYATIGIFPNTLSTAPVYTAFLQGETKPINVPGSTGVVNMQACSITSQECSVGQPNGTVSGDTNCMLVIAADRPFGH